MKPKRTVAIIVAAGSGERAGGTVPKQFTMLGGRPVLAHSVGALRAHPAVDDVLVVIGADQEALLHQALGDVPHVVRSDRH